MQQSSGLVSSQPGRLEALRAKHAALQARIDEEQKRPATSGDILKRLKRQKLMLKEQISEEEVSRA